MTTETPDVRSPEWHILGEGFGAVVWQSQARGQIVRIARIPNAGEGIVRQLHWLPYLAGRLPVAVPEIRWHVLPGVDERFPHGAMMYPAIFGRPLRPDDISPQIEAGIVDVLVALHGQPVPPGIAVAAWHADLIAGANRIWSMVQGVLRQRLPIEAFDRLAAWQHQAPPATRHPVVVHGDFWHDNLLYDPVRETLSGVVDWDGVAIGHPAQDLVPLRYLGRDVADRMAAAYVERTGCNATNLAASMEWFWAARDFGGIAAAIEMQDDAELEDAVAKLRAGPILAP